MKHLCQVAALIVTMAFVGRPAYASQTAGDAEKLQGSWEPISVQFHGNMVSHRKWAERLEAARIDLHANRLTIHAAMRYAFEDPKVSRRTPVYTLDLSEVLFAFTPDVSKTPKELTFHEGETTATPVFARCIYAVENDRLTICWGDADARPSRFQTSDNNEFVLVVYRRFQAQTIPRRQSSPARSRAGVWDGAGPAKVRRTRAMNVAADCRTDYAAFADDGVLSSSSEGKPAK